MTINFNQEGGQSYLPFVLSVAQADPSEKVSSKSRENSKDLMELLQLQRIKT